MRDHHPTFEQVYVWLRERGPSRVLSSRGTEYTVIADVRGGRETIIASPRRWFLDTAYDGESFFVRHAYFTGGDEVMKLAVS